MYLLSKIVFILWKFHGNMERTYEIYFLDPFL